MPTTIRCKGLEPSPDGTRCLTCDRPVAEYPSDVPGQVRREHKRGNWRLKGQVGVLPRIVDRSSKPKRGWTVAFTHGGPAPVWSGGERIRKDCADCDAAMQLIAGVWRCPWTSTNRYRVTDDGIACDWPYRGGRQDYAPFGARAGVNAA